MEVLIQVPDTACALGTAERKEQPIGTGSWGSFLFTGDLFDGGESSNDRNHEVYSNYLCIMRSSTEVGSENRIGEIGRVVVDPGENRVGSTDPLKERGWKEGNLLPHIPTDTGIAPNKTCIRDNDTINAYIGNVFCLAVPQHCPNTVI